MCPLISNCIQKHHYVQYLPIDGALPWISFLSYLLVHPGTSNFDVKPDSPWCGENNILHPNCNSWYGMAYWKYIPKNTPFSFRLGIVLYHQHQYLLHLLCQWITFYNPALDEITLKTSIAQYVQIILLFIETTFQTTSGMSHRWSVIIGWDDHWIYQLKFITIIISHIYGAQDL